jgi:CHAT domain-containing protein
VDEQLIVGLERDLPESYRETVIQTLLTSPAALPILLNALPESITLATVDCLKYSADRHWMIDPNRSVELGQLIYDIGLSQHNGAIQALGFMAQGDALKLLGRMPEAWDILGRAGDLYELAGDAVGWGRTRIGRLYISLDLNRVQEALVEAERARAIFVELGQPMRLLRLLISMAQVYGRLGDHLTELDLYHDASAIAQELKDEAVNERSIIYNNMGNAAMGLGDLQGALQYYLDALSLLTIQGQVGGIAVAKLNVALIYVKQGYYRQALRLFHEELPILRDVHPVFAASNQRAMVECFLYLNRYQDACDLATQVVEDYRAQETPYEAARTLLLLAMALGESGQYDRAQTAIDQAEMIFQQQPAQNIMAVVHLRRGQIALRQGDLPMARREAASAAVAFEIAEQQINYATAMLLNGQVDFALGDLVSALQAAEKALWLANNCGVPSVRYSAHLLLGRTAEATQDLLGAMYHFQRAMATVEETQRDLSLTLRPGFLEDKGEAQRLLIRLYLQAGQCEAAFDTLERAKAQTLLGYLAARDCLRWPETPQTRPLIDELNILRGKHQWLFTRVHRLSLQEDEAKGLSEVQATNLLAETEHRMRAITEQLYLYSQNSNPTLEQIPGVIDIQTCLDPDTVLIEYYSDGNRLWAFILDSSEIDVYLLPIDLATFETLLEKLEKNLMRALRSPIDSPSAHQLTSTNRILGQQLYRALLEPLLERLNGRRRLVIVPHSTLHYLPFNLLYTGEAYLIEQAEIVILPSASLITYRGPHQPKRARVLGHSCGGELPHTLSEVQIVRDLFGGDLYQEADAIRETLTETPCQILHIAAHGEHRLDQPDLSYIQLADGQLFTDDLLQSDMRYELVTLSACESGRAQVVPGDELIGLGRGFLYSGAGALVASLWRVNDALTVTLMEHFYRALCGGASKASALRDAQCKILKAEPRLHPAYWGAFQLIGDPSPLSSLPAN